MGNEVISCLRSDLPNNQLYSLKPQRVNRSDPNWTPGPPFRVR